MSSSRVKCHVLVDFDGTIAPVDTTDLLLERFADPAWEAVEADWKAGRIGSRECLVRQIDLVRATPEAIDCLIGDIAIDRDFPRFVDVCRSQGHDVTVVSDGLDRTVASVLARHGLDLPYRANRLEWVGGDRWRLGFPHARHDCRALSGNCKCQFAGSAPGIARIVIGDGRSDFCVAGEADLVLAKGALVEHCRATGIGHIAFRSFAEAIPLLTGWVAQRDRAAGGRGELREE